jgi:RNA polymerase sigma-70 factor (ECF subfamily)
MEAIWRKELRGRQRRNDWEERLSLIQAPEQNEPNPSESRALLQRVELHVLGLPEEQRSLLMLACVHGLSYKEAADTAGIPVGTVMSRLSRARLQLMTQLEADEEGSQATKRQRRYVGSR